MKPRHSYISLIGIVQEVCLYNYSLCQSNSNDA